MPHVSYYLSLLRWRLCSLRTTHFVRLTVQVQHWKRDYSCQILWVPQVPYIFSFATIGTANQGSTHSSHSPSTLSSSRTWPFTFKHTMIWASMRSMFSIRFSLGSNLNHQKTWIILIINMNYWEREMYVLDIKWITSIKYRVKLTWQLQISSLHQIYELMCNKNWVT